MKQISEPASPLKAVDTSRRGLLGFALLAPVALAMPAGRAHAEDVCFDPNTLPGSQKSFRKSLNFKMKSPDPAKRCGLCTFFTTTGGDCGKCQLLSGGPVFQTSVCDSWAAKG